MVAETLDDLVAMMGWNQKDLAEASGLHPTTVSNLCAGQTRVPMQKTVGALWRAMGTAAKEQRIKRPSISDVRRAIVESYRRARFRMA